MQQESEQRFPASHLRGHGGEIEKNKRKQHICYLLPLHLPEAFGVRSLRQRSEVEPGKEKERYSCIVLPLFPTTKISHLIFILL